MLPRSNTSRETLDVIVLSAPFAEAHQPRLYRNAQDGSAALPRRIIDMTGEL
jgi:hypothetical protein